MTRPKIYFLLVVILLIFAQVYSAKKAIVIGASSGIGAAVVRELAQHGYDVGLMSRREEKMQALVKQLRTISKSSFYIKKADVADLAPAGVIFHELLKEMGNVELIILNAGIGIIDPDLKWDIEKQMIDVNVRGFTYLAQQSIDYFKKQKQGHLVGISSVLGARGMPKGAVYCATKAFVQKYLEGLRATLIADNFSQIFITDIRPGYVDTDMIKQKDKAFWMVTAEQAAGDIYDAIQDKSYVTYVSHRWWLISLLMQIMPHWLIQYFS